MDVLFTHDPTSCGPGTLRVADPTVCPLQPAAVVPAPRKRRRGTVQWPDDGQGEFFDPAIAADNEALEASARLAEVTEAAKAVERWLSDLVTVEVDAPLTEAVVAFAEASAAVAEPAVAAEQEENHGTSDTTVSPARTSVELDGPDVDAFTEPPDDD